ncbi:hypothetical protein ACFQVA_05195 [Actinomadura keratinilytica]
MKKFIEDTYKGSVIPATALTHPHPPAAPRHSALREGSATPWCGRVP